MSLHTEVKHSIFIRSKPEIWICSEYNELYYTSQIHPLQDNLNIFAYMCQVMINATLHHPTMF